MFTIKPQANFPAHNLNGEGDGIESSLPFEIFSTLSGSSCFRLKLNRNPKNVGTFK